MHLVHQFSNPISRARNANERPLSFESEIEIIGCVKRLTVKLQLAAEYDAGEVVWLGASNLNPPVSAPRFLLPVGKPCQRNRRCQHPLIRVRRTGSLQHCLSKKPLAFRTFARPVIAMQIRSGLIGSHFLHRFTTGWTLPQMCLDTCLQLVWKGASEHGWHILLNFMAGDAAEVILVGHSPVSRGPQPETDSTNQSGNTGAGPQHEPLSACIFRSLRQRHEVS